MKKIFLGFVICIFSFVLYSYFSSFDKSNDIIIDEIPQQTKINPVNSFDFRGNTLTQVATFEIKARVLSKENYYFDRESEISPTDLALGWGSMSDMKILDKIDISQSGRFYYWSVDSFPILRKKIETQSANMHLIPSSDKVKDSIKDIRKNDIVQISGTLVNAISKNKKWYWNTSQTRDDTGAGACELIFVESIKILEY